MAIGEGKAVVGDAIGPDAEGGCDWASSRGGCDIPIENKWQNNE